MMKNLVRQNHNEPDFDKLNEMNARLDRMLTMDANAQEKAWTEGIEELIAFQDRDGSFKLVDSFCIESDACIAFCVLPHHKAAAILMRALPEDPSLFENKKTDVLLSALKMSSKLGLRGHGYDAFAGLLDSVKVYLQGGVQEFLRRYPEECPEFTAMMKAAFTEITSRCASRDFTGTWGESYEKEIRELSDRIQHETVFVYGTLLQGQPNHDTYLANRQPLATGVITGYEMYDIGRYPGIIRGVGQVKGEIYHVTEKELHRLDMLEGEGVLYIRKPVQVMLENGETILALVYVYNRNIDGLQRIPFATQPYRYGVDYAKGGSEVEPSDLVWYVSYGSNMLEERFLCYLQGGTCRFNGKHYNGCTDQTPAIRSKAVSIPFDTNLVLYC